MSRGEESDEYTRFRIEALENRVEELEKLIKIKDAEICICTKNKN
tara:strand:+ start:342 stop:476 length:135 start_codon:yes stop_codon:yes gene_type:complete